MKRCVLCKRSKFSTLFEIQKWKIRRCISCGLVKTFGKMDISYEHYHRDEDYQKYHKLFENIFQKRYDLIKKFSDKKGRVLEVGSSTGNFLSIFKKNGWEVIGIEPSESALIANEKGIRTINQTFEKAKLKSNHFDLVLVNHTLEHIKDPVSFLQKINFILKSGGKVYIDVPNFASLSSVSSGKAWKYLLPKEHIHHFEPETLQKCLERAGFNIVYKKTWSGIFDVANPLSKLWFELSHFQKSFFADIFAIPGNLVTTLLNRGTNLAMIGEKV